MASSVNNTTNLRSGRSSSGASQFVNIAANRYNVLSSNDPKMMALRGELIAHVSNLGTYNDKINILATYMSLSTIDPKDLKNNIDTLLADAMLIYMDADELDKIVARVKINSDKFAREIKTLELRSKRSNSILKNQLNRQFQTTETRGSSLFRSQFSRLRKDVKESVKLPRSLKSSYNSLRRELNQVFKDFYNDVELTILANRMGIEIPEKMKDLKTDIINKVVLFVSMVQGTLKNPQYLSSLDDLTPYNELLQYTSLSYITGKKGISASEIQNIRKNAQNARDLQKKSSKVGKIGLFDFASRRYRRGVAGNLYDDQALYEEGDTSVLSGLSTSEIFDLAIKYNVPISSFKSNDIIGLKRAILNQISKEGSSIQKLQKPGFFSRLGDRLGLRSFSQTDISRASLTESSSSIESLLKIGGDNSFSDKIPIITFNKEGKMIIPKASVPVYITGSSISDTKIRGKLVSKDRVEGRSYGFSEEAMRLGIKKINSGSAAPVYMTNAPTGMNAVDRIRPEHLSVTANSMNLGVITKAPTQAVYVVNAPERDRTREWLDNNMTTVLLGLQQVGLSVNTAAAAALGVGLNQFLSESLTSAIPANAKGATGIASKQVSHFISGDSLTTKPNPELVSIDYDKKSYQVKPIPQFATGGKVQSLETAQRNQRMTVGERNAPLSVGISSHLVTYNRSLSGVTDDMSNKALKVYNIKPGITDTIDVGGTSTSLIDIMVNMLGSLRAIESTSAIDAQMSATIADLSRVIASNTRQSQQSSSNPFSGGTFPTELDSILKGV